MRRWTLKVQPHLIIIYIDLTCFLLRLAADEYFHTPVQGILARTPAHLIHFIARPVSLSLVWRHVLGQCAQVRWRWLRWQGGEGPRREKEARARPVDHALVRQGMTIHGKWPCIVYAIRIDNTNTYNAVLYSMPLALSLIHI